MRENAMHLVQEQASHGRTEGQGLAVWLLALVKATPLFAGTRTRAIRKHMRVVEALPMGPKRHLYLVSCDGERFLVGAGADCVQTIVRVRPESAGLALVQGGEDAR